MENMTALSEYVTRKEVNKPSGEKKYNLRGFFYVNVDKEKDLIKELDAGIRALNPNLDQTAKGFRKKGMINIVVKALEQHNAKQPQATKK
jgi:hypothetical protein